VYPQEGEKVEYRPIGGAADNVSTSTGIIEKITDENGVRIILRFHVQRFHLASGKEVFYSQR
jgi:hypothetical protein